MNVEKIFRQVDVFSGIVLDIILFESKYPIMFTCKKDNEIYLFICCMVNADIVEWIGTRTDYDTLIGLLENKITIRDAFLNVTDKKYLVKYDGLKVSCEETKAENIPDKLLPSAGEYMDAEEGEYAEEIEVFKFRNRNFEYRIQPCLGSFWNLNVFSENINFSDDYFNTDLRSNGGISFNIGEIANRNVKYA